MKFECPACAQHLDGDAGYAGRSITCPACGHAFVVPRRTVPAAAPAAIVPAPVPVSTARPAVLAPAMGRSTETSKLAVASLALSLGSLLLGPLGFVPGIVCGHLAKARLRRNAMLGGAKFATVGLAIGYSFLVLTVAAGVTFFTLTGGAGKGEDRPGAAADVSASAASAGTNDYSMIDVENTVIPSHPAAGPLNGSVFHVRRAKIEQADLVLKGDSSQELPEIRLHPETGVQTRSQFKVVPLVENAARFKMATQLQPNGMLAKSCTVTLKTADGITDLTSDAGIRLVFHAPKNGVCKTSMHLAFGPDRKEYVLGEFVTELSPELMGKVKGLKP